MTASRILPWIGAAALIALPFVYRDPYHLHILVLILIWSFAYTSWSMMGRFGLVSLGHGGFMGVGAYVTALLWNHLGISPWIGIPIALACAGALAGLASCLLVLQYDIHPFVGLSFGPITFLICVLGGLGNFVGGFVAAFVFAEIISLGGLFSDLEWGYVLAFAFFIVMMFIRPAGLLARRS